MKSRHKQKTALIMAESERLRIHQIRGLSSGTYYRVEEKLANLSILVMSLDTGKHDIFCYYQADPCLRACTLQEAHALLDETSLQGTRHFDKPFIPLGRKRCETLCQSLRIPPSVYAKAPFFPEACRLQTGGLDCFGRPFQLHPLALAAWRSMQSAAATEGISLAVISGFRSYAYQAHLIRKKIQIGQDMQAILQVNATPGHSEHHTGLAVDLHCPEEANAPPPLSEAFENTKAFYWLTQHAQQYGFRLSYPRNNRHGFIYEPWHWCLMPEAITDTTPYTSSA